MYNSPFEIVYISSLFILCKYPDDFTKFIQYLMVVVPPEKDEADAEENHSAEGDEGETEAPMIAAVV